MEPEYRNRRRRSIRHLRRSSGFYTDSFTPAHEVEVPKADSHDDNLVSAYGSIWLESDNLANDTDPMVTHVSENSRHSGGKDIDFDHRCEKQAVLLSSRSSCEFSESSFNSGGNLNNHQSLNSGSLGIQYVSGLLGTDLIDVNSLSLYGSSIGGTSCPRSPKPPMVHLGVDGNCGNDRLHENICHDETILKENQRYSCEVVKTVLTDEVIRNVVAEKLPDPENVSQLSDDPSTVTLKERRKSDRLYEGPEMVKDSECKPKKRKRLSLKKIRLDSANVEADHVYRSGETNSEVKINVAVESDNNINDSCEKMIGAHVMNSYNINSTNDTEWTDPSKWSDNPEFSCVDHVISQEIGFGKDFLFQDFQVSAYDKKSQRSPQSKAKAARRSSRLFSPCEMPLKDLALDENPTLELSLLQTGEKELHSSETNNSAPITNSPRFSGVKNSFRENKENIQTMDVYTTGKIQEVGEVYSTKYVQSVGADNVSVKVSASVEGVVEDFAHLCMNEKTFAHSDHSIQDLRSARRRDAGFVVSDTNNITVANVYSCTSTDADKRDISNMHPYVDTVVTSNNLQDLSTLQENIFSNREVSFHSEKFTGDYEEQNGENMEDQPFPLDTAFSTLSADVDMDELLSPDKKLAEHETDDVISESGMCVRRRRGRKSWDTNQKPDARKKPGRRKSQQGSTDKQINKLMEVNKAETCADAPVTELADNDSVSIDLSPGLESLYRNKNFVAPQPRSWETIKESPKSSHFLFTKQRHKCFLEFETGITRARLLRRHKKAVDVYKKIGGPPSAISDKEFEQKMLDIQLSIGC